MTSVQRLLSDAESSIKALTRQRPKHSSIPSSAKPQLVDEFTMATKRSKRNASHSDKEDYRVQPDVCDSDSDSGIGSPTIEMKKFRPAATSTPKSRPKSLKEKLDRYAPSSPTLLMPPPSAGPSSEPQTPTSPALSIACSQSQETGLDTDFDSSNEDETTSPPREFKKRERPAPSALHKQLSEAYDKDAAGLPGKMDDRIGMKRTHTELVMEEGKLFFILFFILFYLFFPHL